MRKPRRRRRQPGHTLFELIAASTIIAVAISTTLSLMADSMEVSRDLEQRHLVTTLAVSKMEEHLALATAGFVEGTYSGNFAAEGQAGIRFSVQRSCDPAVGGQDDLLMTVTVVCWRDYDGNGARNGSEPVVTLASKVSNITAWSP